MLKLLKLKKVTAPVAILITVVGVLIYFSDRLVPFIVIKYYYSKAKTPEMYIVPHFREVQHYPNNFRLNYDFSTKDIKFKAPWKLREKVELNHGKFFTFMNTKGIEIVRQDYDDNILGGLLGGESIEAQKLELLYGKENLESEYAFINLILHTSPDQAGLFKPLPELVRVHPLLLYKLLCSHSGDIIYKFSINDSKGFQFGNPEKTENVRVHVFSENDQVHRLLFVRATQAEIDYILSTIKFIKKAPNARPPTSRSGQVI